MLEHIKAPNPKLKAFVQHTAKQFLACSVQSGLIKIDEYEKAEEMLNKNLRTVLMPDDMPSQLDANIGRLEPIMRINNKYNSHVNESKSFNDEGLESLKQVLFHEFTHFLQHYALIKSAKTGSLMGPRVPEIGYQREYEFERPVISHLDSKGNIIEEAETRKIKIHSGKHVNELATAVAEQLLMYAYYKNIKGMKQTTVVEHTYENKNIGFSGNMSHPVDDPLTHIVDSFTSKGIDFSGRNSPYEKDLVVQRGRGHSNSYTAGRSVIETMFNATGITPLEFARGSTVFGDTERTSVVQKYNKSTGADFGEFVGYFEEIDAVVREANRLDVTGGSEGKLKKKNQQIGEMLNILKDDFNDLAEHRNER